MILRVRAEVIKRDDITEEFQSLAMGFDKYQRDATYPEIVNFLNRIIFAKYTEICKLQDPDSLEKANDNFANLRTTLSRIND